MADYKNRVRVGGSGFTVFTFQHQPIAFCQQVAHTSPQPVAAPVAIQPMDEPYPIQVITPAAAGMGSLTLNLYELYGARVWERLGASVLASSNRYNGTGNENNFVLNSTSNLLQGAIDIVDVFIRMAATKGTTNVVKYINPPNLGETQMTPYTEEYHGCVITNIVDGEEISVGTMEVIKQITIAYTHMTRDGGRGSAAFAFRDNNVFSSV